MPRIPSRANSILDGRARHRPALRLGVPDEKRRKFGGDALSEKAFKTMVTKAQDRGATIVPIDLTPFYATAVRGWPSAIRQSVMSWASTPMRYIR